MKDSKQIEEGFLIQRGYFTFNLVSKLLMRVLDKPHEMVVERIGSGYYCKSRHEIFDASLLYYPQDSRKDAKKFIEFSVRAKPELRQETFQIDFEKEVSGEGKQLKFFHHSTKVSMRFIEK